MKPGSVLLLGEIHGTMESPAFVLDVACHAARAGLAVVVGLELYAGDQARADTFLASPGTDEDRTVLLASNQWQRSYQDGRNSHAMVDLIEGLRQLRARGSAVRVVMFDAPGGQGGQQRDRDMGRNLAAAVEASPGAMTIVLTGNNHSRITPGVGRNSEYEPMGYVLAGEISADHLVALNVTYGRGSAWICTPGGCGVTELSGRFGQNAWSIEIEEATRPAGHSGWYHIGSITASPPARMSAAEAARVMAQLRSEGAGNGDRSMDLSPPSPPLARPDPSRPLSETELKLQGAWQGWDFNQRFRTWAFWIEGRSFRAEAGPGEWYVGQIVIDTDQDPAWIDFAIEDCNCSFIGSASTGIFEWDGDSLVISAPTPDDPRPQRIVESAGETMRLVPADGIDLLLGEPQ